MSSISVIVPCYNEEAVLPVFYDVITRQADSMRDKFNVDFEFLFINDGSRDNTLSVIKSLAENDARVKYISFSRNFGKEAAMYAGLQNAEGDYAVIMDADLQDPPELLDEMYKCITEEGYDCAAARRVSRKGEPLIRSFFARLFYRIINKISNADIADGARDFRLMTRRMIDAVLTMTEYNRFTKGILSWVGFNTKWLEFENAERAAGETKWSLWGLFLYSIDGIAAFSTAPLAIASVMGFIFCVAAFIMVLVIVLKTLIWGDPVAGYPSLICVILLVSGVQMFCIGILGQYLAKTYMETKKRPIYIIKETNK